MKDHGYRELAISSVVLPGDFTALCEARAEDIQALRESSARLVMAHAPTIERGSKRLVCGRRRMGAYRAAGVKKAWFHVVSGTADELLALEASEDLHRSARKDTAQMIREYVGRTEAQVAEKRAAQLVDGRAEKAGPGRPKTARGEAREQVALETGRSPDSIRKADARAEQRQVTVPGADAKPAPPTCAIETLGIEVSLGFAGQIAMVADLVDVADRRLQEALGRITRIDDTGLLFPQALRQRLQKLIKDTGAAVRAARPSTVCPFCKDPQGTRREHCSACAGLGYLTREQAVNVPGELLITGKAAVVADGKGGFVAVADWKPPAGKRAAKKVRVEDEHGREITVEREPGGDGDAWGS